MNNAWLRSFVEAVRFLTLLPTPGLPPPEDGRARVVPLFPLVGALIGALLCGVGAAAGARWGAGAQAALVVVAWGVLTGGLHLDGLSDTFDAVLSWRPRARKLEIMKDSRIGALGALALVAVFALKIAFLSDAGAHLWRALLLAPVLGRWALVYGLLRFPAARTGGLGQSFRARTRPRDLVLASAFALALALMLAGAQGLAAAALVAAATHALARWWSNDLGGLTGDTYGALCEIGEVVALAALTVR